MLHRALCIPVTKPVRPVSGWKYNRGIVRSDARRCVFPGCRCGLCSRSHRCNARCKSRKSRVFPFKIPLLTVRPESAKPYRGMPQAHRRVPRRMVRYGFAYSPRTVCLDTASPTHHERSASIRLRLLGTNGWAWVTKEPPPPLCGLRRRGCCRCGRRPGCP